MLEKFRRLNNFPIYCSLLLAFSSCILSNDCPEAASEMAICLHTYLERDFTGLEPFLELSSRTDKWRLLINEPELESECSKIMEMVNCYAELDGECYDLHVRRRYSYLVHTLFRLYTWLCDKNNRLKILLENIACIIRVQRELSCQSSTLLPVNVWQRMLRLESGTETCRSLQQQVACAKRSRRIHQFCGNNSHALYINGMEIWLEGWCIDQRSSSSRSTTKTSPVFIGVMLFMWKLVNRYSIIT